MLRRPGFASCPALLPKRASHRSKRHRSIGGTVRIAVIIPTLNEERVLQETLDSVFRELRDGDVVIVADGGSDDRTLDLAKRCEIVTSIRGRGCQLDAGAQRAIVLGADLLFFLHADSHLPVGLREHLAKAQPKIGGGCLIHFAKAPKLLAFGARLINWRTRRFKMPLGDQGQFATRAAYLASGGFPHWPVLEDTKFRARLARLGPLTILPLAVRTNSRRFQQRGVVRTVVTNWTIWTLYVFGASPKYLATLYRNIR